MAIKIILETQKPKDLDRVLGEIKKIFKMNNGLTKKRINRQLKIKPQKRKNQNSKNSSKRSL